MLGKACIKKGYDLRMAVSNEGPDLPLRAD